MASSHSKRVTRSEKSRNPVPLATVRKDVPTNLLARLAPSAVSIIPVPDVFPKFLPVAMKIGTCTPKKQPAIDAGTLEEAVNFPVFLFLSPMDRPDSMINDPYIEFYETTSYLASIPHLPGLKFRKVVDYEDGKIIFLHPFDKLFSEWEFIFVANYLLLEAMEDGQLNQQYQTLLNHTRFLTKDQTTLFINCLKWVLPMLPPVRDELEKLNRKRDEEAAKKLAIASRVKHRWEHKAPGDKISSTAMTASGFTSDGEYSDDSYVEEEGDEPIYSTTHSRSNSVEGPLPFQKRTPTTTTKKPSKGKEPVVPSDDTVPPGPSGKAEAEHKADTKSAFTTLLQAITKNEEYCDSITIGFHRSGKAIGILKPVPGAVEESEAFKLRRRGKEQHAKIEELEEKRRVLLEDDNLKFAFNSWTRKAIHYLTEHIADIECDVKSENVSKKMALESELDFGKPLTSEEWDEKWRQMDEVDANWKAAVAARKSREAKWREKMGIEEEERTEAEKGEKERHDEMVANESTEELLERVEREIARWKTRIAVDKLEQEREEEEARRGEGMEVDEDADEDE